MDRFINPYTFFPISGDCPERGIVERDPAKANLTGVMECELSVVAGHPVFIPNTSSHNAFDIRGADCKHKSYEFYSYDDLKGKRSNSAPNDPIIPGSEIRGMIRNVYEQLTNSCLPVIDGKNLPYKRTPEPKKACVMKYDDSVGKWFIYDTPEPKKVEKVVGASAILGAKGDITGDVFTPDPNGRYTLHVTGTAPNPKHSRVFDESTYTTGGKPVQEEDIKRLIRVCESYCDEKVNKHKINGQSEIQLYQNYLDRIKGKETVLVYADDSLKYLSPSSMTKEYFETTIEEILEKQSAHNKCKDKDNACPACRLFGMIGDGGAIASRIKFTDTYENVGFKFGEIITLPILATPHISAIEFYLLKPYGNNIPMWNYDYFVNGYEQNPDGTINYNRTDYEADLSGRKVYWHGNFSGPNTVPDTNGNLAREMNCSIRPLESGTFKFKVYFEDLTLEELENLKFCIDLAGVGIHKIGKGKPLGMGDVEVRVSGVYLRDYSVNNGKISVKNEPYQINSIIHNANHNANIQLILKYQTPLDPATAAIVQYPERKFPNSEDKKPIYEWFGANRGSSVQKPTIDQILPDIGNNDVSLTKN